MKKLYKVEFERKSYPYKDQPTKQVRELWADSPDSINTCRLAGFQQDSINILSVEYIRDINPIEVELDPERNEITALISVDHFLKETLKHAKSIENDALEISESQGIDIDEALESLGYVEVVHDNSYNYCSDLQNDLDFKVFVPKDTKARDWIYNDEALVFVREHTGLDARCGYVFKGIYRPNDYEGLCYFLDQHIRVSVMDNDYNVIEDFDGDSAIYSCLRKYALSDKSTPDNIIIIKDSQEYTMSLYNPAEGV